MIEIPVSSSERNEFIDITGKISEAVSKTKIESGFCIIYVPHTTAAVTINEGSDPDVQTDLLFWLNEHVKQNSSFRHFEGNSDSHVKSSLIGCSVSVLIESNALVLGAWQKIFFCEFDGPRKRKVFLKIFSA
ncbi:MAG: secondary thiamine-phosphate synthase enzyme YjbQ [archaeon]